MSKGTRNVVGVVVGVAVVMAALAMVVSSSIGAEPTNAAKELNQLQARVKALGPNPSDAEWNKVKSALDGWAKKHKAQTVAQERARPAQTLSGCPRTVDGPPGFYCYYASSSGGKCYYTCVKL